MRLLHLPQDDLRVPIDLGARVRHDHALLASCQQLCAEVLLQRGELLTEGRLRDVENVRGPGNAPGVDNDDEGFETPDIH
ncbi:hypothetical protein ABIA18_000999 [Sinorhizobium fredii]